MERDQPVRRNLLDAGCGADLVERFFQLGAQGRGREQQCLLSAHRQALLDQIHAAQRQLDCLDYLLYRMEKENGKREGSLLR